MKKMMLRLLIVMTVAQAIMAIFAMQMKKRYESQEVGPDEINAIGILGGVEKAYDSKRFQGGYVRAMMGGLDIDLRDAVIEAKPITIEATVLMAGVDIKVPPDWVIENRAKVVMGEVEDERHRSGPASDGDPDVILTGRVTMGAIEVS